MIKQTARSAPDREQDINSLFNQADFNNDSYVKEFDITVSKSMMEIRGRILPPPKLQYGGRTLHSQVKNISRFFSLQTFCYTYQFDKISSLKNYN